MRKRSVSQSPGDSSLTFDCLKRFCSTNLSKREIFETSQLLLDERTHTHKYRQFYSLLKFAHQQLQMSYSDLEQKFASSLLEWASEKNALYHVLQTNKQEKADIEATCALLQSNCLTEERLELIKLQVANDFEQKYKEHLVGAQRDAEAARKESRRLEEELAKIKTEAQNIRSQSEGEKKKLDLLHYSEKKSLCDSHKEIMDRLSTLLNTDTESLVSLYKENMHIRAKCNLLVDGIEKIKNQFASQTAELKMDLKAVIEQLSKANSENGVLRLEKDALSEQVRISKAEVQRVQVEINTARQKAISNETLRLGGEKHLESVVQRSRMELADLRLEAQRQRVEIERQRDELAFQVQEMTNQISLSFARFDQIEEVYQQREQEAAEREIELRQIIEVLSEENRSRVEELHRKLDLSQSELDNASKRYQFAVNAEAEMKRSKEAVECEIKQLRAAFLTLSGEHQQCKFEMDAREKEIRNLESALEEVSLCQPQDHDKAVEDISVVKNIEKTYSTKLAGLREAYSRLLEKHRKLKIMSTEKVNALSTKLEEKQSEAENLHLENIKLKGCVPKEDYLDVKAQLQDFRRRSEEYAIILQQTQQMLPFALTNAPKQSGDEQSG